MWHAESARAAQNLGSGTTRSFPFPPSSPLVDASRQIRVGVVIGVAGIIGVARAD